DAGDAADHGEETCARPAVVAGAVDLDAERRTVGGVHLQAHGLALVDAGGRCVALDAARGDRRRVADVPRVVARIAVLEHDRITRRAGTRHGCRLRDQGARLTGA